MAFLLKQRQQKTAHYNLGIIFFHWLIAIGLIAQTAVGLAMNHCDLGAEVQFRLYQFHISLGITLMVLIVLRLVWRFTHKISPLPTTLSPMVRFLAKAMHTLLYVFQLFLPLSGWALVSVSTLGLPTLLFGVLAWPDMPILSNLANKAAAEALFREIHHWAAWVFLGLVILHSAAALWHLVICQDGIFMRILPSWGKKPKMQDKL